MGHSKKREITSLVHRQVRIDERPTSLALEARTRDSRIERNVSKAGIGVGPHSPDDALSWRSPHADSDIGISTLSWIKRGGDGEPGG
jgi:hypothetical protein